MKIKTSLDNAKETVILLTPENERDIYLIGQLTQKMDGCMTSFSSSTDQLEPVLEFLELKPKVLLHYLSNSYKSKS